MAKKKELILSYKDADRPTLGVPDAVGSYLQNIKLDDEIKPLPVNNIYANYEAGKDECCNAGPTSGIPFPESNETGIYDVEISKTRWANVTTIVITLAVTGIIAYAIHVDLLIKLAGR